MRNVELKARCADLGRAEETARRLGASGPTHLRHRDTFFGSAAGRLKLREIGGDEQRAELIFYQRSDVADARLSNYQIAEVAEADALRWILAAALGVEGVVVKERRLYLYENVRIHLDRVEGLGSFVELEAALKEGASEEAAQRLLGFLRKELRISDAEIVARAYRDLLAQRQQD